MSASPERWSGMVYTGRGSPQRDGQGWSTLGGGAALTEMVRDGLHWLGAALREEVRDGLHWGWRWAALSLL